MSWEPQIGDHVRVDAFNTLPAFYGTIEEKVGVGFYVRSDTDGRLWFIDRTEMRLSAREAAE